MALNPVALSASIKSALQTAKGVTDPAEAAATEQQLADNLANAIHAYVSAATVNVTGGTATLVTPGTGSSGPVTGTGTLS